MTYRSLSACVADLEAKKQLVRIDAEIDPHLELAAIQRRLHAKGGPAVLFTRIKGTAFPCLANLYGTEDRVHFLFRKTLRKIQALFALAGDPGLVFRRPLRTSGLALPMLNALPRRVKNGPILAGRTALSALPQLQSWPLDGGAYITLPQVYTENPDRPGWLRSNLGMYRVQISGPHHARDEEAGLHYQIHRGIANHHAAALRLNRPLRVSVFVGGPPAHALAAVMPLPEGIPELAFAGVLAGRRFRYIRQMDHMLSADADFCLVGTLDGIRQLPEGPFGDHLGYYSLAHDFPVLKIEAIYHRRDAIWPFTVVGRPPQEDSHFATLIHSLTRDALPAAIPGIRAVHAVEESGVHPLLLAVGSERYVPYAERRPRELLTQSHAILGFGQLSLAKFLFLVAGEDDPGLNIRDVPAFFRHVLLRLRLEEDLHYITRTTMDTLDYSGHALHAGSKLAVTVAGSPVRELANEVPSGLAESLPPEFPKMKLLLPGVVVVQAPPYVDGEQGQASRQTFAHALQTWALGRDYQWQKAEYIKRRQAEWFWHEASEGRRRDLQGLPLWVLVDDADFACRSMADFLWVAFTRCDPAADTGGAFAFMEAKHWGCFGPWVFDSRTKPHHAPPLEESPETTRKIETLAASNGPLHGLI